MITDDFFNPLSITLFSITGAMTLYVCIEKCFCETRRSNRVTSRIHINRKRKDSIEQTQEEEYEDKDSTSASIAIDMPIVHASQPRKSLPVIRENAVENPIISMHMETSHSLRKVSVPSPTKRSFGSFKSRQDLLHSVLQRTKEEDVIQ